MSKTTAVLRALKEGRTLTALDAQKLCGTMRLASIVHSLRGKGHPIVTRDVKLADGTVIAEYSYDSVAASYCRSGQHQWSDPTSRARCCNGFHQVERWKDEPMVVGEVSGGHQLGAFNHTVRVWVRD